MRNTNKLVILGSLFCLGVILIPATQAYTMIGDVTDYVISAGTTMTLHGDGSDDVLVWGDGTVWVIHHFESHMVMDAFGGMFVWIDDMPHVIHCVSGI